MHQVQTSAFFRRVVSFHRFFPNTFFFSSETSASTSTFHQALELQDLPLAEFGKKRGGVCWFSGPVGIFPRILPRRKGLSHWEYAKISFLKIVEIGQLGLLLIPTSGGWSQPLVVSMIKGWLFGSKKSHG